MARLAVGDELAASAPIRLACSASIEQNQRVLLIQRPDDLSWGVPGGGVTSGETVAKACHREVLEETGLAVQVRDLIGVYSDPSTVVEYEDGNRFHVVALHFRVVVVGGELRPSAEALAFKYASTNDIRVLDIFPLHRQRLLDSFAFQIGSAAFIR